MAIESFASANDKSKPFCVYWYLDPRPYGEGTPIYVGKGSTQNKRHLDHWRRPPKNYLLAAVMADMLQLGLSPIVTIVELFDDEFKAYALERKLIALYGRRNLGTGTLCNLTDGGDGVRGVHHETMKEASARRWARPEEREKMSKAKKGIRPVRPDNDRWIMVNGEKKQLLDWATALGCHPAAIIQRVKKQDMTWEQAVTTPIVSGKGAYQVTLSREQGAEIIRRYIAGEAQEALAREFSVSGKTILNVLQGKRFPELPRDVEAIAKSAEAGTRNRAGTGLMLTHNGETHSIKEWSALVGIHENVIRGRKRRGLSDADALAHVNASGEHNRRISPSDYPEIARLHAAGEGATLIARRYGVVKSTIGVLLRKMRALPEAAE